MLSDVEIAQQAQPRPINDVAAEIGIADEHLEYYGRVKAKISLEALRQRLEFTGRLVLVTAITPTPAGEGKTTTTVGLGDALRRLGNRVCIALREPSLGPCFGVKGGAAGGGYAQVIPMEDINLHFTGDFHAITSAHNLLAALLDNHLHHGNQLDIDVNTITWKRVMDMNERSLRDIVIGLGDANGLCRQTGFEITTASEVMALLCLASDVRDLHGRLGRIMVALDRRGKPVTASDLNAAGAMATLLKDAIKPNLVQTLEGTPAFVHGGPFGNIAHGCNSAIATRMALAYADIVVTEAGFGSDLGAEKFANIKCRTADLKPEAAVVVATIRALKMHGGMPLNELQWSDPNAVLKGIPNLLKHIENVQAMGLPPVVAINRFPSDTAEEIAVLNDALEARGVPYALSDVWAQGGAGGEALARLVISALGCGSHFRPTYPLYASLREKIEAVAKTFYGASGVTYTPLARRQLREIEALGFGKLPVCIAKTQSSLSDDPKLHGRPDGFKITVREAKVSAGAGFVVVYAGNVLTMPGLPKTPAAERISVGPDGRIAGLS